MPTGTDLALPPAHRRLLRYRWLVFSAQVACLAVVFFLWVVPATIGEQLVQEWQLSATSLGFLGSFLFYPYALMQLPSGYLADTWGPRRTVTAAMIVMAVGEGAFTQAGGLEWALAGRALTGLGASVVLIAIMKIVVNWFRAGEFATLVGLSAVIGFAGAILGTAPLAFLVFQWGWRWPLLLVAGLTLVLALLNWVLVRDTPAALGLPAISQLDSAAVAPRRDRRSEARDPSLISNALRIWLSTPTVWAFSLIVMLSYGSFQAFQFLWAGPYLLDVHEKSAMSAGASLWLLSLGGGIGPFVSGYLSDNVLKARRPFLIGGTLGTAIAWGAILVSTRGASTGFINFTFLLLSFSSGWVLIGQTMVKEAVRPAVFGTVFGLVNMFPFIGNALYQLLMGVILNASALSSAGGGQLHNAGGYWLAFLPAFVAGILSVIIAFFLPETFSSSSLETQD